MNKSQNTTKKNSRTNEKKEKARLEAFRAIKPKPNTQKAESITNESGELPHTIKTVFKKRQLPPTPLRKINNVSSKPSTTKMNKPVLPNNNSIRASLNENKLSSQNQTLKLSNPPHKPLRGRPVLPSKNNKKENGYYSTFGEVFNNTPPEPPPRNRNHWSSKQFRPGRVELVSPNNKILATRLKQKKKATLSSTETTLYTPSNPPPKPPRGKRAPQLSPRNYRENRNIMKLLGQNTEETTI